MKSHKVLRGLSIVLIVASLLMLMGGWVTLKKEYRRELKSAIKELDYFFDEMESRARRYLDNRDAKDIIKKLDKAQDKAVDILEDGALSITEGRYILSKTVSIMSEVKKMLKKNDMWEYSKDYFNDYYGPLVRVRNIYNLFLAATVILALAAAVLHILKKKHSGIPAFVFFLIWTIAAFIAAGYINKEAFYEDIVTITAWPILAPLCMLASVILWKAGYKAYLADAGASAPAPVTAPATVAAPVAAPAAKSAPAATAVSPEPAPRYCSNCGRAIPSESAKFCPGCGNQLQSEPGGSQSGENASGEAEPDSEE